MIAAFFRALGQLTDPPVRRVLWRSIALSLLLIILLVTGLYALLAAVQVTGLVWLDTTIDVLGGLGALVGAYFLFPAVVGMVAGFFLDAVADAVEARHYPGLPPARSLGMGETVLAALRFFAILAIANLAALALVYLIPVLNLIVFYVLNGYLLGREYFELVALRRMPAAEAAAFRKRHGGRIFMAGAVVALVLSIPIVNLIVPILGTAFMVHIFQGLVSKFSQHG
ncbi:EI24 domain-containing protein [Inquilinus sp. CAU 1745]|uniref:EI24 domain-containing protein n=1 Tax=Inquilinus sp. CAU 1745 TaxID=3140369 RepID=UPI00325B3AD2